MYESHWQLKQKPFENFTDSRFYFPGESHQAALLKLRYAIENKRGCALLTGASGIGKTLVVDTLKESLGQPFSPFVHLIFPQMSPGQLLAYIAGELDGTIGRSDDSELPTNVRRIENFLVENTRNGQHVVLVIDEAQLIEDHRTFETLRLFLNFESDGKPGLTLLIVAQPTLLPVLDRMPQLDDRFSVKCLLRPFTRQETSDYVTHRLKVAGAQRAIFDVDATTKLHELTHGVARQINRLCDLALLIGYAEGQHTITADQLEAVCQELVTVVPE